MRARAGIEFGSRELFRHLLTKLGDAVSVTELDLSRIMCGKTMCGNEEYECNEEQEDGYGQQLQPPSTCGKTM